MVKKSAIFENKWFILGIGLLNLGFTICLCVFAYWTFFYTIEYVNLTIFAAVYSVISLLAGLIMYHTRNSPLTAVFCMANVAILFPVILMDWGNWGFIVPAFLVTVFGFFCCHMNDTIKTVMGTIYLLLYIIGGIAFFLLSTVFTASTVDTLIDSGISPSGDFRYHTLDQKNNAMGKTVVYIEPNRLDVDLGFIKLDTTIKRLIKQANNPIVLECEWDGAKLYINGMEHFDEEDYVTTKYGVKHYDFSSGTWTHTYFALDYPFMNLVNTVTEAIGNKLSESE